MTTTYTTRDIMTTRIGDTVKVEIRDPENPRGTLANYGNVRAREGEDGISRAYWSVASGQSGTSDTERKAVHAAARAIRAHAKREVADRERHAQLDDARLHHRPAPEDQAGEFGTYRVLSASHHRNGIGGTPFYVGIVRYTDGEHAGQRFQIVTVPTAHTTGDHEGEPDPAVFWSDIFVTNLDMAARDDSVAFGYNSWRGDRFQREARAIYAAASARAWEV